MPKEVAIALGTALQRMPTAAKQISRKPSCAWHSAVLLRGMTNNNNIHQLHKMSCGQCHKPLLAHANFTMIPLSDGWRAYICDDCKDDFNAYQERMGGSYRI